MNISEKISPDVRKLIKRAIEEVGGNEVLFIGHINENGNVVAAEAVARGNEWSVPALSPYLNKSDVIIHNHPSRNLTPSNADMAVASIFGNQGVGFFIVDNSVEKIYVVAEPVIVRERKKLDSFELTLLVKEKLPLTIEGFEERDPQLEMLQTVCDSFNNDRIDIIEAGTGVGKSLAYLVPAFDWALKNGERVVISTATINLQQQIYEKDIKIVEKLFGKNPDSFLIKGRGNYLCKRRLYEALEEVSLFEEENEELMEIAGWAESTDTGDRSDLSFYPSENVWSRVRSEGDICLGLRCKYHSECFVFKTRRQAAKAKVLVVNHHLLFSDLSMRLDGAGFEEPAILPSFSRVIFDEAHNIEKSASSFFSQRFSSSMVKKYLQRIIRKKKGKSGGIYYYFVSLVGTDRTGLSDIPRLNSRVIEVAEELNELVSGVMGEGRSMLFEEIVGANSSILDKIENLRREINRYLDKWESVFEVIEGDIKEDSDFRIFECKMFLSRLGTIAELCSSFLDYAKNREIVFWVEKSGITDGVYFISTPIEIGGIMGEALYGKMKTIVFTSATLTVNRSFEFWKKRVGMYGLQYREVNELLLESPFNYQENVFLGLISNFPMPDEEKYEEQIASFIASAIAVVHGHALVLFTSYKTLINTYKMVRDVVERDASGKYEGINFFIQGTEDRARLLKRFKEDISSVLFATDSFWEGIDAPGETLKLLVITRLPFRVPNEPVIKARLRAIKNAGGNPFMDLSLPEAIIRLKQGFGRLIRNKTDKGGVIILDSRVVQKVYGTLFLKSLPTTKKLVGQSDALIDELRSFFDDATTKKE